MTANIRILLAQIAVFEQQHRAGINPLCGEICAFFDTARLARQDVAAVDAGLTPPVAIAVPRVTSTTLERVTDVRLPGGEVARFAKALLDALDGATVTTVGGRGGV